MSWEHIRSSDVKRSRKRRTCSWYGERIEIGEPYHWDFGKYEGTPVFCELHPECHEAMKRDCVEEYDQWEQVRGLSISEMAIWGNGRIAWDNDIPRTPPANLTPDQAEIWLRGWDMEEADCQKQLARIARKGAGETS